MNPGMCFPAHDGRAFIVARAMMHGRAVAVMECPSEAIASREAAAMNAQAVAPYRPHVQRIPAIRAHIYGPEFGDFAD